MRNYMVNTLSQVLSAYKVNTMCFCHPMLSTVHFIPDRVGNVSHLLGMTTVPHSCLVIYGCDIIQRHITQPWRHMTPLYLKGLSHFVLPGVLIGYTTCSAVVLLAKQNSQWSTCGSVLPNPSFTYCRKISGFRCMASQFRIVLISPGLN